MLQFAQKLAQKPSDTNIRIIRVVFALLLVLVILFGLSVTVVNFSLPREILYVFFLFPVIGLIRGILDPGIFRKKLWKYVVGGIGIVMLLVSLILIDDVPHPSTQVQSPIVTTSGEVDINSLTVTPDPNTPFTLSMDNSFGFFGFILIIVGFLLNNKNITTKNERYGEKVTKIRV